MSLPGPQLEAVIDWAYPLVAWGTILAAAASGLLPRSLLARPVARWIVSAAVMAVFVPVEGMPLGRWLHGVDGGISVPFVCVLLDRVVEAWRGRPLLDRRARVTAAGFGAAAGLALYPAALGLGAWDPYELGWTSSLPMIAIAAIGAALIARRNAFGIVLLVAGLCWQLDVLESENAWDYLVDPIYAILSWLTLMAGLVTAVWRRGVGA
jgi:hypothetical protein